MVKRTKLAAVAVALAALAVSPRPSAAEPASSAGRHDAGAVVSARVVGNYLLLQRDGSGHPWAVDLTKPGVRQVLQWARAGVVPSGIQRLVPLLAQADPQMYSRPVLAGHAPDVGCAESAAARC
jgi:hypothetical protein